MLVGMWERHSVERGGGSSCARSGVRCSVVGLARWNDAGFHMLFSSSTARSSWQRSRNLVTRASKASRAAWSWRVPTPLAAASRARMAAFSASRASCAVRGSSVRTRSVEAAASVARLLRFLALWSSHARRMAAARTRSSPSTASHADSRRTASSSATWSMATTVRKC